MNSSDHTSMSKGFSLVEALIAVGVTTVLGGAVMTMLYNSVRVQKSIEKSDAISIYQREIHTLLGHHEACENSFRGLRLMPSTTHTITTLKARDGSVIYQVDGADMGRNATIKSMTLSHFVNEAPAGSTPSGSAALEVRFIKTGDVAGPKDTSPRYIQIHATLGAGGTLQSCVSRSHMTDSITNNFHITDGIWRLVDGTSWDTTFTDGNVGIGISAPTANLHVKAGANPSTPLVLIEREVPAGVQTGFKQMRVEASGKMTFETHEPVTPLSSSVADTTAPTFNFKGGTLAIQSSHVNTVAPILMAYASPSPDGVVGGAAYIFRRGGLLEMRTKEYISADTSAGIPGFTDPESIDSKGIQLLGGSIYVYGSALPSGATVPLMILQSSDTVSGGTTIGGAKYRFGRGGEFRLQTNEWANLTNAGNVTGYSDFSASAARGISVYGGSMTVLGSRIVSTEGNRPLLTLQGPDTLSDGSTSGGRFLFGRGGALTVSSFANPRIELYNRSNPSVTTELYPNYVSSSALRTNSISSRNGSTIEIANPINVNGNARASSFNATSDIRLKEDLHEIENPLETLLAIRGYKFRWRSSKRSDIGVVAQEVQKHLPELVDEDNSEQKSLSVNYNGLVGIIIEAIRAIVNHLTTHDHQIESLKKMVEQLQHQNQEMKKLCESRAS